MFGIAANWIMFYFIVRVILKAKKEKAQQTGDSNVTMRIVSYIVFEIPHC